MVSGNINIFISPTKLDEIFQTEKISLKGFGKPYMFNCNQKVGGMILYIREDILSRIIEKTFPNII